MKKNLSLLPTGPIMRKLDVEWFEQPVPLCQSYSPTYALREQRHGHSTKVAQLEMQPFLTWTVQETLGKVKKPKSKKTPQHLGDNWDRPIRPSTGRAAVQAAVPFTTSRGVQCAAVAHTLISFKNSSSGKKGRYYNKTLGLWTNLSESHKATNSLQNPLQACLTKISLQQPCEFWDPGEGLFLLLVGGGIWVLSTWVLESDGQRTVPTLLLTGFVTPGDKGHLYALVITLPVTLCFTLLDYRRQFAGMPRWVSDTSGSTQYSLGIY